MIQPTLPQTKSATYAVLVPHPNPEAKGFPIPMGTGFFVSKEGYFLTARHVLLKSDKSTLHDAKEITFVKPEIIPQGHIDKISIVKVWPNQDLILLKADFDANKAKETFKEKTGFDFIEPDFAVIPEGTEVYSYGYPLASFEIKGNQQLMIGLHYFSPRTTSAIISSHHDVIGPISGATKFPRYYVIDKALNYGNSGGPIVVQETGRVVALCSRFQPVKIPQGGDINVSIPSLYGVATSLKNIEEELKTYLKL